MDFEKKLKYLDVMFQTKELAYSIETGREIDYYSLFYIELKLLLNSVLGKQEILKENVRVFIDNLDIILKYTNNSNMEWIYYDCLYKEDDFLDALIKNIPNMRFKHHICFLVARICNVLGIQDEYKKLLNDEFVSKLLELPIPYEVKTYGLIYDRLDNEGKFNFFKMLLKTGKKMDFSRLGIDALNYDIVSYIGEHVIEFALNSLNIIALRDILINDKIALDKMDDYFVNHKDELANLVMHSMRLDEYSDNIKEIMELIVLDIINNENAKLSDISWRFGGSYSDLLIIKDKIVKYGSERSTRRFPNNPYIVKPLLRKNFVCDDKSLFVEVVECELPEKVTENQMYELYKNFRDINLIWQDVKKDNVGILKKDNVIYWNGNLNPCDEALELDSYRGEEKILKAGDVILLDADSIFDLENEIVSHNKSKYFDDVFEERYQKELSLKK